MALTATLPRRDHFSSLSAHGFHRVVYFEWGDAENPRVAVCVHGVGRNARDFDVLAETLAPTHRVLAIDMPGRGESDWLADPNDYVFPTYLTTLTALIARSGADAVDWVGTSMGGLLGIVMAAQPKSPIARLVVNDVGPAVEPAALDRIRGYFGLDPTFATYGEIEQYVRTVSAPFGSLTDRQWAVWDAIRCPTLVLRGARSDLLSKSTAAQMAARGPLPAVVEFEGVGHAPMLLTATQIGPVAEFLRS
jgi:pimeloyl-ACP methyl ester carboxylesterase